MKKLIYILFALLCLCACEPVDVAPGGGSSSNTRICRGYGYDVVYTVRGSQVCQGYGYTVVYTIRGDKVCDGYGYNVAYTIRDDKASQR